MEVTESTEDGPIRMLDPGTCRSGGPSPGTRRHRERSEAISLAETPLGEIATSPSGLSQ